jgi:16S rRNA processing protein RimM
LLEGEIVVGHIGRPHGLRGELVVQPAAGDPELLIDALDVTLDLKGRRLKVVVRDARMQGKFLLLAFEGYPDRTAAEPLVGAALIMRRDELPEAEEGEHYISSLIGRPVTNPAGVELGRVADVEASGSLTWLVVQTKTERRLVPFTEPLVTVEDTRIVVDAPKGLLEGEPE